jgi:hypothetical protein
MQQEQTIKDLRARVRALESELERRSPRNSVATSMTTPLLEQEVAHSKKLSDKIRELDAANCRLEEELFEEQQLRKKQQDEFVRHKDDLTDEISRHSSAVSLADQGALACDAQHTRWQYDMQHAKLRAVQVDEGSPSPRA